VLVLKKVALLLTLVLTLFSFTVFADNNDINNEEINNILSSKEEQDTFNKTIANSQDDKNISIFRKY
jgi:lipopolysaccharide export LptBFGC system permease protein LptF